MRFIIESLVGLGIVLSTSPVASAQEVSALSSVTNSASDTVTASVFCHLKIETVTVDDMSLDDTLDVTIDASGFDLAGFSLRIAVSAFQVDILEVLPGEVVDSCGWNMFTARPAVSSGIQPSPHDVWQISGLARGMADTAGPPCYAFDRPATLARLVVSSSHLPSVADTSAAVFFYWETCRDNVLSDTRGLSIMISDSVAFTVPVPLGTERERFPTVFGAPPECTSSRAHAAPRRVVDFASGGVIFRYDPD